MVIQVSLTFWDTPAPTVLRAPSRTKLAKDGSYEKWMLEMEVGLRHRNPYASGILKIGRGHAPLRNPTWIGLSNETFAGASISINETPIASYVNPLNHWDPSPKHYKVKPEDLKYPLAFTYVTRNGVRHNADVEIRLYKGNTIACNRSPAAY